MFNMTKEIKNIIILVWVVLLFSCSDSNPNDSNPNDSKKGEYVIKTFEVTGTSQDVNGIAPISPSINNGNFTLKWEVEDNDSLYKVQIFVSNNDVLSNADIEFYKDNCLLNDCGNNNPFTNDCFFNNNHDIWCEKERILEKDKINLQSFLNTIPKDAYIILKSCDVSGLSCSQATEAVRFE